MICESSCVDTFAASLPKADFTISTLEEAAAAVDDPGLIRELGIKRSVDSLEGLELFPNVEKLSVDAGSLSDVDAVIRMRHLNHRKFFQICKRL